MMKRSGVPRLGPDDPAPLPQQNSAVMQQQQQPGASNMHTLAQSVGNQPQLLAGATAMLAVSGGEFARRAPPVISYMKPQYAVHKPPPPQPPPQHRHKPLGAQSPGPGVVPPTAPPPAPAAAPPPAGAPPAQFQRLKVEDALSYLDQVKYKFNAQPQVYNDFLDIMKEFKSQTIDTPGVITRVSNLFQGHPELIVGFNTFLPPGYKIEVQSDGHVSVSMPSPSALGAGGVLLGVHHTPQQAQLVHLLPVAQSVSSAIVHNLSVSAPANTLHHIQQAHQQIEAAAIHQGAVPPGANVPASHAAPTPPGQPVEFNHAIEYVNKIKSRFSRQPDKYKRFLEILHAYQRGHRERDMKQPQAKQQTEQEVYSQVAKLFENQDDLLAEFGQFLPDAGQAVHKPPYTPDQPAPPHQREGSVERYSGPVPPPASPPPPPHHTTHVPTPAKHPAAAASAPPAPPPQHHHLKRSPSFSSSPQLSAGAPPAKKPRPAAIVTGAARDVSYAEAAKYGTMHEYNFFDRVRKVLKSQRVYDNFLRCLLLFTNEIISSSELLCVAAPFLSRYPELQRWLQDFVGPVSPPNTPTNTEIGTSYNTPYTGANSILNHDKAVESKAVRYEPIGAYGAQLRHDRPAGDAAMDVDLSTCKRLGTSYCALPRGSAEAASRRCSGRTPLCKEVLNDTWVSFPTWSEDSTFVTSRKTQYEEYIYRCEDERFELDVVIETNAATIRVLEGVQKKLSRMSVEEAAKYRLDECLGGHSPTIHQRALKRIYGEKVAVDIIAGLKKNPVVAVPVVLRRLKAKEEEWREAQKGFNKQWREQNEKYYLKSLDHQGINFKQNDLKAMRSKCLFNEVESAYAAGKPGPHVLLDYGMTSRQEAIKIVRDAAELLIHHARRQTAIQKAEKRRIKQLLRQFLPDLLEHPRQPASDDEKDDAEEKEEPTSPASTAAEETSGDNEKSATSAVKQEKEASSESDNASEKSAKHNKNNKENTPKNNNNTEGKPSIIPCNAGIKRSSSNDDSVKSDTKMETDQDEDFKENSSNEARFVCTSSWYLFLRLHGVLCQRLALARRAATRLQHERAATDSAASALRLKPNNLPADVTGPADYYTALLELVKGVLDGNTEASAFEDAAREMLGIHAYPAYTLDKLVSYATRQLQHCVSEPWSIRAAQMAARGGLRGPLSYVRRAKDTLSRTHHHVALLVRCYSGDECRMTFELLEGGSEDRVSPSNDTARLSPTSQSRTPTNGSDHVPWSLYGNPRPLLLLGSGGNKPVFLARNARRSGARECTTRAPLPHHARPGAAPRARKRCLPARGTFHKNNHLRQIALRPHHLYRRGSLKAARDSAARLNVARQARFRAWLRRHCVPAPALQP